MKRLLFVLALFVIATPAYANTAGYAWSESVGWFDFSRAVVTDTGLTGHAYNDNTGWLVLEGVTNADGIFSGYAWSESVGWFDFSGVNVESGSLRGYAYNDNTGWLSFEDGTTVTTAWSVAQPAPRRISSVGSRRITPPATAPAVVVPVTIPSNFPTTVPELQVLLQSLQAQLQALLDGTPALTNSLFTRDLELNAQGDDVKSLQQFLISKGYSVPAGATGFFGSQTLQALIKFQADNRIVPAAGYFGPVTRSFINALTTNN